ncbi:hypothetical protein ABIF68_000054 [Bradyrhizobium japonicum]
MGLACGLILFRIAFREVAHRSDAELGEPDLDLLNDLFPKRRLENARGIDPLIKAH